jgi:hypothetical protein
MVTLRLLTSLRTYSLTISRIAVNTALGLFARKAPDRVARAPDDRRRESVVLHQKFGELFERYDECERCIEHCCHSRVNRFDLVDVYLTARPASDGFSKWHRPGHLKEAIFEIFGRVARREEQPPDEVCEHLELGRGCRLSIEDRPAMCVAGVCSKLIAAFSDEDLRRYNDLLKQHAELRWRCILELARDMRKPAAIDAEAGGDENSTR